MSNPKFYAGDLEDNTYTMSLSENTSYPLANLSNYILTDLWKSSADTNNQWLKIDLGTAKACDFISIDQHNFNSMTTVTLQVGTTDDGNFAVPINVIYGSYLLASGRVLVTFGTVTKRYWRILFENTNSTTPQLGQVFIGSVFDSVHTQSFPYKAKGEEFLTTRRRSISGIARGVQVFAGVLTFELKFEMMDDTFRTNWLSFHQKVRGGLCPFYFSDDGSTYYYMLLDKDLDSVEIMRYQLNNLGPVKLVSQGVGQNPL